jgi:hypothetical protein
MTQAEDTNPLAGDAEVAKKPRPRSTSSRQANAPRSVNESTTIQLKIALSACVVLCGAAFSIGRLLTPQVNTSELTQLRSENERLKKQVGSTPHSRGDEIAYVVGDIFLPDEVVDSFVDKQQSNNDISPTELAIYFNVRGLRIYRETKAISESNKNIYDRSRVKRSQSWFSRSAQLSPQYPLARWNLACMSGLLSDPDGAIEHLNALMKLAVDPDSHKLFLDKIASDTDFCPISDNKRFEEYIHSLGVQIGRRPCPQPAIRVE